MRHLLAHPLTKLTALIILLPATSAQPQCDNSNVDTGALSRSILVLCGSIAMTLYGIKNCFQGHNLAGGIITIAGLGLTAVSAMAINTIIDVPSPMCIS